MTLNKDDVEADFFFLPLRKCRRQYGPVFDINTDRTPAHLRNIDVNTDCKPICQQNVDVNTDAKLTRVLLTLREKNSHSTKMTSRPTFFPAASEMLTSIRFRVRNVDVDTDRTPVHLRNIDVNTDDKLTRILSTLREKNHTRQR